DIKNGRHRIEHASILRKDQIKRIARLGVVASIQPRFVITDWWAKSRVGDERVKWIYPFKSMLENDVSIGFGTDCPVEVLSPWETVYAAVTRGKYENVPYYEDSKEECLTLEEALYAYTFGSAYIMFEEANLGTLEERKLADFIVVDRDPFEVEENELKGIKILETYVGGKRVF
ncbi:amidohydrolase, partial [Caldicellulosiruptor sp. F32]|uniref:amidohydrolase n=1 Tax=Caldicellulosiruptor sp. F32 TaxID=1214564 RepID=UPI000584537F